jgi:hypothetical protein
MAMQILDQGGKEYQTLPYSIFVICHSICADGFVEIISLERRLVPSVLALNYPFPIFKPTEPL